MRKRLISPLADFFRELKRREVYPIIAGYAVVSWILLQIGEVTFAPMGLPDWVMVSLIVTVILGFPVAMVLAWVYDITPNGIRVDTGFRVRAKKEDDRPSIAVLPFVDMSPDNDQEYFCEGIAEEILNGLTTIRELRVVARSSAFQYRQEEADARQFGKRLGVDAVLEGSVRKSNNRLRVNVQLVNLADGYDIWSKSFDEEPKDVFSIQDEIAREVVDSLLQTITEKHQKTLRTTSCQNTRAYDYYLRGRQYFNRFQKIDIESARQMFRQALEIDPGCSSAWTGYADCYSFLYMFVKRNESYRAEAHKASQRALELAPGLADAHASRGLAYLISEQLDLAEAEFDEALRLNPMLSQAYYYRGRTGIHQGNAELAAKMFEKACEVDPADYQSRFLRVQVLRGMGRMKDAIEEAKKGIAIVEKRLRWHPDDARALQLGAGSLILIGEIERGKRWLKRAMEIDPDDSILLYNVACHYATLGQIDESLDYLESAIEKGAVNAVWMKNDEDLANLRNHPRYESILRHLENQSGAEMDDLSTDSGRVAKSEKLLPFTSGKATGNRSSAA